MIRTPLLNVPPSPLHRFPSNRMSRKRRWRRSSTTRSSSKVRSIARCLRVITRRIQTRLILRRPHARDAIRSTCWKRSNSILLAVERLRCELAVGVVVVGWGSVGGGLLLLAVVVIGVAVIVVGEQALLLGGLGTL
jgi:hypothetical protein